MNQRVAAAIAARAAILVMFFLSGAAALVYQVAWQRLLFTTTGVNIESLTIIVSMFMFGLGIGSLLGGAIADAAPRRIALPMLVVQLTQSYKNVGVPIGGPYAANRLDACLNLLSAEFLQLVSCPHNDARSSGGARQNHARLQVDLRRAPRIDREVLPHSLVDLAKVQRAAGAHWKW